MKILTLSDTHGTHSHITIPNDIDMLLFAGDAANYKNLEYNNTEYTDFINWLQKLNVKYKVVIAGNHDRSLLSYTYRNMLIDIGVYYLENDYIEIQGLKIWGSPITPEFNNWFFTCARENTNKYWQHIPEDTDILITHGPPKGIGDLCVIEGGLFECAGDSALLKAVMKIKPLLHVFGHIHDPSSTPIINNGIYIKNDITFINTSCVTDGKMGKVSSMGYIVEIENKKIIKITKNI